MDTCPGKNFMDRQLSGGSFSGEYYSRKNVWEGGGHIPPGNFMEDHCLGNNCPEGNSSGVIFWETNVRDVFVLRRFDRLQLPGAVVQGSCLHTVDSLLP